MPFAARGHVSLYYEVLGDVSDPVVLLLNGAGKQSIDAPDAFCHAIIAKGFAVIRFDQRDTGLSTGFARSGSDAAGVAAAVAGGHEPMLAYDAQALAGDAFAVLDAASVGRAHLFGRSLGGYVAQLMALDHSDRVLSITLAMAFSRAVGTGVAPERLQQLDSERFADGPQFAARQIQTARALGNPDYFDEAQIHATALHAFARGVPAGSIARHFMVGLAAPDLHGRIAQMRVPVQIIHGRRDKVIPLAMAQETAAAIPGAHLAVLEDMAHEGPRQLWDRWIDLFVANTRRGEAGQTIANT